MSTLVLMSALIMGASEDARDDHKLSLRREFELILAGAKRDERQVCRIAPASLPSPLLKVRSTWGTSQPQARTAGHTGQPEAA